MIINIADNTIVYICCPANTVTGGPEALHQLYYYMKQLGYNCVMSYYNYKDGVCPTPDRYLKYCKEYIFIQEVRDNSENIIIIPESQVNIKWRFNKIRKCIWWLSVVYFNGYKPTFKKRLRAVCGDLLKKEKIYSINCNIAKKLYNEGLGQKDIICNFAGSKFAYDFLKSKGIKDVEYLVEPISKEFLDEGIVQNNNNNISDKVLYNPAKPSKVMKKLLRQKEISFLPLKGFTPEQLISIYRQSKLYIDFGKFGGPERIPKEAVYNGCNILVGKRNAAVNDFDIAIPDKFKIEKMNTKLIIKQIKIMLQSYKQQYNEFNFFRGKINNLEENFIKQIKANFVRYNG